MDSRLYIFWIPIIQYNIFLDNICKTKGFKKTTENKRSSLEYQIQIATFSYKSAKVVIDFTGFIYIQTNNINDKDSIIKTVASALSKENLNLINSTILNSNISSSKKDTLIDFLGNIILEFDKETINKIDLQYISYSIGKNNKLANFNYKFNLDDNLSFYYIINRNFKKLLEKSVFYSHGLKYENNEIVDLANIIDEQLLNKLTKKIIFDLEVDTENLDDNEKIDILKSIIKKAIQDTIEEKALLYFLKKVKTKYITNIYDKINNINIALQNLNSKVLAIDSSTTVNYSEETIEVFVQNLLESIPKFNAIDSKIKNAYYIKIGNMTTNTAILDSETIEHTLYYQKWKSSIEYFKNMALSIKEIITVYHQNRNIKGLEDIAYYANYQADLEDIKNIKGYSYTLSKKDKNYISKITLIIAIGSLSGEAPIFEYINIKKAISSFSNNTYLSNFLKTLQKVDNPIYQNFIEVLINAITYLTLIVLIYFLFKGVAKLIKKLKNSIKSNKYSFEETDFDKHEHRSTKPLTSFNKTVVVEYNDLYSAYDLIERLKELKLNKYINCNRLNYSLFPKILQTPYTKKHKFKVTENYRITRVDKVITKILIRYKVLNLSIKEFIKLLENDSFYTGYQEYININQVLLNKLKSCKSKITLYIVYSFNLKLKDNIDTTIYRYDVIKDQYRVHYHIEYLRYKDETELKNLQKLIANIVYLYFIARFKKIKNKI